MIYLLKVRYLLLLMILTLALTGCELARSNTTDSDVRPVEEMPPTLAPLGAENSLAQATAAPTLVTVQPIVTEVPRIEVKPVEKLAITPTVSVAPAVVTPVVNSEDSGAAVAPRPVEANPVVVNPAAVQEPAANAPVAANPPASETMGNYGGASHTVQAGDTLFFISRRYGVSIDAIKIANGMVNDVVQLGRTLVIPTEDGGYAPAPVGPTIPFPNDGFHIVTQGETLFGIAMRYNMAADAIASVNGISYPYVIYAGQRLALPAPSGYAPVPQYQPQSPQPNNGYARTHTIAAGETLFSIANRYGTTAQALAAANGLSNPNQIYVGQVLYLP